jgi:hypothetical protein
MSLLPDSESTRFSRRLSHIYLMEANRHFERSRWIRQALPGVENGVSTSSQSLKLALLVFLCFALVGCELRRPAEVREFPAGYRGEVIVIWDVSGYPPILMVNGKLIERFPADGVLITSTKQPEGWANDEEYFVDAAGRRLPVRPNGIFSTCGVMNQNGHTMIFESGFVGTEQEARASSSNIADRAFNRLYPPK